MHSEEIIVFDTFVQHRNRLVQRFMETGSVLKRKREGVKHVLTDEVVNDIQQRIETSPHKSLRKLSAQAGITLIF